MGEGSAADRCDRDVVRVEDAIGRGFSRQRPRSGNDRSTGQVTDVLVCVVESSAVEQHLDRICNQIDLGCFTKDVRRTLRVKLIRDDYAFALVTLVDEEAEVVAGSSGVSALRSASNCS